ncbi:MAG: response regulator [Tannerellaceae bacterium]|nr:response regulator [Tannerellaceae bacterium]
MNFGYTMRHTPLYLIIVFLSLFIGRVSGHLSVDDYHFSYLTARDGMAQNTVNHIYKDSYGFMWFATWNGLNRFDGYEFIRYGRHTEKDAIQSLFVNTIAEDNYKTLWVGTEEGVSLIDLSSGKVKDIAVKPYAGHKIFTASIHSFALDSIGNLWIGYEGGLATVSFQPSGEIAMITSIQEEEGMAVLALYVDPRNRIWVGYRERGIRVLNWVSGQTFQLYPAPGNLPDIDQGTIFCFYPDNKSLWIGTDIGLFCYNPISGKYKHYKNNPLNPKSLLQDYVKDIIQTSDGNLVLATYKGICIMDKEKEEFLHISNNPDRNFGLSNNFCSSLYIDEHNTIWIGTEKGGVNKMDKKGDMFKTYRHNTSDPSSISPNPVNAIYEDQRGNIWVGTVEGGLNKLSHQSNSFLHFKYDVRNKNSLSHNAVCYIIEGGGYLWIATWGGGLNRMPLTREGYFEHDTTFIRGDLFKSKFISAMVYDTVLDGIWATTNSGLEFLDLQNMTVIPILQTAIPDKRITSAAHLFLDQKRILWVGTEKALHSINLNISEVREGKIISERHKVHAKGKPASENDKINCLYSDRNGTLWIGTYGNGLFCRVEDEEGGEEFINYGTDAGLADNVLYAIEEDQAGNLWLSSNNGISCFNPVTGLATTFAKEDGLPDNQYYWTSSHTSRNGRIYFGSINGMVSFDPEVVQPDTSLLKVEIVGGWLYNERKSLDEVMNDWTMHERDKSFSISFSSLYYPSPEKIRYAYMLEGFDRDWTEVDATRRFVTYTNLSAGKYTFKVKCTNPDGRWSEAVTRLSIRIIPPFYKERWFMLLILFLVILSLYAVNEWRTRNLRKQKQQLEQMVEERTEKIESQKNILAKQANDLEETLKELMINQREISKQNKMLIEKNDEISLQKQQLEQLSDKLQQATQDKINFFTNITHEFKTPLTLILGPIEQALKLSINPKVIEQLQLVRKNSKYLLSLINQLMDFRKADTQTMKINKTPGNFHDFLHAIVLPFDSLIHSRSVKIEERIRLENPYFRFDHDLMQKVIVNLLSNAIKFTPDDGYITVCTTLLNNPDKSVKYLYISVNDSGSGIPEEKKVHIFDPFFQLENKSIYPVYGQSGTGIGLYLCRQIIELLGGRISVKNNSSGGASFRILIPLDAMDLEVEALQEYYDSPEVYDRSSVEGEEIEPEDPEKPVLLVVEDNTDMRAFIKSILKERFTIIEASNGQSGLAKTVRYVPDFILSDIMMPVMDGLEFCKKVKNNFVTSHIPVILLTAKSSTDVRIEGYNVGADGYISKPFSAELLLARINNMMESRNRMHKVFEQSLDVKTLDMHEESQDRIFLDKLMEIIQENYQDATFDVGDLLNKMHISKSFLHKKLQSLVGQSAVKVIRSYRLSRAKEIIENKTGSSQLNISEVAYEVGFNDPKYFSRCFTKQYGKKPSSLLEK